MLNRSFRLRLRQKALVNDWWQTLVQLTFGLFMGCLIVLLILLYAGVPLVAS